MKHLPGLILAILLAVMFCGCASVAHTANLATLDDLEDVRTNQHKIDNKVIQAAVDALENRITPQEFLQICKAAIDNSDVEFANRPPAPDRWTEIIVGVIGLLTTGVATFHAVNKSRDNQREVLGEATLKKPVPILQSPQANPEAKV